MRYPFSFCLFLFFSLRKSLHTLFIRDLGFCWWVGFSFSFFFFLCLFLFTYSTHCSFYGEQVLIVFLLFLLPSLFCWGIRISEYSDYMDKLALFRCRWTGIERERYPNPAFYLFLKMDVVFPSSHLFISFAIGIWYTNESLFFEIVLACCLLRISLACCLAIPTKPCELLKASVFRALPWIVVSFGVHLYYLKP